MEGNQIELDLTTFDIVELVEDVFKELELRAEGKKITLKFAKEYDIIKDYILKNNNVEIKPMIISKNVTCFTIILISLN